MNTQRLKKIQLFYFCTFLLLTTVVFASANVLPTNGIIYVKPNAIGDGSSWNNPTNLDIALQWARTNKDNNLWTNTNPLKIYVAKGEYTPSVHPETNMIVNGRNSTFLMVKDVQLYGGFPDTGEPTFNDRNWTTHQTTLKGQAPNGSEVFHVVLSVADVGAAVLDGFTITGGNANVIEQLTVYDKNISSNVGGGIFNYSSSPTYNNVIISGNKASNGAGIANYWSGAKFTYAIIKENTATNNGGGILNTNSSTASFTNILINGNKAGAVGDALHNTVSLTLTNVTIVNNGTVSFTNGPITKLMNSIIWDDVGTSDNYDSYNSLIKNTSSTLNGNIDATGLNITDIFNNPSNKDFTLKPTSPAIDAGNNSRLWEALRSSFGIPMPSNSEDPLWKSDLAGNMRLFGGTVDLGAYEYYPAPEIIPDADNILYVNQNMQESDGSGNSWTNALQDLALALKWAQDNKDNNLWNSNNPLKIYVAEGEYKPSIHPATNNSVNGSNATFLMVNDVQIYGGFPNTGSPSLEDRNWNIYTTTLKGQAANGQSVFHVVLSIDNTEDTLLDGFQITSGNANGSNSITINEEIIAQNKGGGIYIHSSSIGLSNLIIKENNASLEGGGLIVTNNSNPKLFNVKIKSNSAGAAGGGILNSSSSPTLYNVAIQGNATRNGGGMANLNSFPKLTNILISGNTATTNGGGMYNSNSSLTSTNITISGNQASNSGSGIYNASSTLLLTNSLVWGNIGEDLSNSGTSDLDGSSNNLIAGTTYSNIEGEYTDLSASEIFIEYKPATSGNPTIEGNYSLKVSSPIIAKGSNSKYLPYTDNINTDIDLSGDPRIYNYNNGGTIDLGAYEFQGFLPQTITFAELTIKGISDADFYLAATSDSGLDITYESSDSNIAKITDNKVSILAPGSAIISANQIGNADYAAATTVSHNLIINNTLPVSLSDFNIKTYGNYVNLKWATSNENNNKEFVIYKSGDNQIFQEITKITGSNYSSENKNYTYTDKTPFKDNNYYKLVQIDNNGTEIELGIKTVNFSLSDILVQVFPNPTDDVINITLNKGQYKMITVKDLSGNILKQLNINPKDRNLIIYLSNYPSGIYLLQLHGTNDIVTRKILKR